MFINLSYVANLCAILTINGQATAGLVDNTPYVPFDDLDDILDKKAIQIGAVSQIEI